MKNYTLSFLILVYFSQLHSETLELHEYGVDNNGITRASATSFIKRENTIEQNLATLGSEPSAIIHGCVNAITGSFVESVLDLCIPGADPLVVQRLYTNMSGWCINEPERLESHGTSIVTHFSNGMTSTFSEKSKQFTIREENFRQGLTNCSNYISGRTNPHSLTMKGDKKEKKFTLIDGSQSTKKFDKPLQIIRKTGSNTGEAFDIFALHYEQKSNLITTFYEYKKSPFGWTISKISNVGSAPQALNELLFAYEDNFKTNPSMIAKDKNNEKARCAYQFENSTDSRLLKCVIPNNAPETRYEYNPQTGFMSRKIKPGNQIFEMDYYDEANIYYCVKDKENSKYGRVCSLRAPVGTNDQLHVTHRFFYELKHDKKSKIHGTTRVFDVYNQETRYNFDSDSHLKCIEEVGAKGRSHHFFWYDQKTNFDGNLMTKMLQDSNGNIFSCRHYIYDKNGNILSDLLFGVLSGRHSKSPALNALGAPIENGCERYQIKREYSQDGYNHILSENDGRQIVKYIYKPKTDFLHAKLVADLTGKVHYREFYKYDLNGSLIRLVADDGSSENENDSNVTEKHITTIEYRQAHPIGLPQIIEEKYLDFSTRREILLKKTVNHHDLFGNLLQQDHYDDQNQLRYSLKWEYDAHGNVIKEINPLGHTSTYEYDVNDRLVLEQHPGDPFYTTYTYDYSNRLVLTEDVHPTFTLSTRHEYNLLGQRTATIDWQGHATNFEYDRLGRVVKIIYPLTFNENGSSYRPTEHIEYDIANNPIAKIDARGFRIDVSYNIRGQPYLISYPDGSQERSEYTLDGLLEKSIALNGTKTQFQYDYLGRPLKSEIYSPDDRLLSQTSTRYNCFHKLSETDPAGESTFYDYDDAGRLIKMIKGGVKVEYKYDSCQRLAKTLEYFGSGKKDYIASIKEYDILDQVIEERTEDANGKVLTKIGYVYNERGECMEILTYQKTTPNVIKIQYHPYGDIAIKTDPIGNSTNCQLHYNHLNAQGQCVFAKETVDAMGNSLFLENDSLGRLKFEIRRDSTGTILQKREFLYDECGNCIKQVEHIITPNKSNRKNIHVFEYDSNNNMTRWVEAVGTPEQKLTRYIYNDYQQKITIVKPSHVELQHAYDWLGRLDTYTSSDHSFHYKYTYDANSNVICVNDFKNNTSTERVFDVNARLIKEKQASGLVMHYAYDGLSRTTQIILPDQSSIDYQYDSLHLTKVKRGTYTHTYEKYNLSGLVEKVQMIGSAGSIQYSLDSCNRLIGLKTKYWQEQIPKEGFDKVGNVLKKNTTDALGTIKAVFSYNKLYQLEKEKGIAEHTFKHDSIYNLIKKDKKEHKINALNQLLDDGYDKHEYDANGNLVRKGSLQLIYDALDRLITVVDGIKKIHYRYDELNRRISTTYEGNNESNHIYFFYQGQNEIGACDTFGKITQLRVLGLGKGAEIGASILFEFDGKAFVPIHDIAGNVSAILNPENGIPVETYRYTAYGQEELYDGNNVQITSVLNPWRFTSKRTDPETAFVYFGHRYYNPATARWVTADPLGLETGPNLYAYLNNNPLNNFDLYGLEKCFGEDQFNHYNRVKEDTRNRPEKSSVRNDKEEKSYNGPEHYYKLVEGYVSGARGVGADILNFIAHHLVPFPIAKDLLQVPAHVLRGSSFDSYTMSYRQQHSIYEIIKGSGSSFNAAIVNGMNTSYDQSYLMGLDLFTRLDGRCDVYISYNATHGLIADGLECIGQFIGICTHATEVFDHCMTAATAALGDYGNTFLNAHSQGGLICYDGSRSLSSAVKSRIDVFTIGSPIALSEGMYGAVENVAASWDPISWGTRLYNGAKSRIGLNSANINVVKTKGSVLNAHFYGGKTYDRANSQRAFKINGKKKFD